MNAEKIIPDEHLHVEVWEEDGPNYLDPTTHQDLANSPSSEIKKTILLLALDAKNDKRLSMPSQQEITIENNRSYGHKEFHIRSPDNEPRDYIERAEFEAPIIPLELTLLNLSRDRDNPERLRELLGSYKLVHAQFFLNNDQQRPRHMKIDAECFRAAVAMLWK
ncbi:hypothetical protein OQA88_7035 [Cercophora sp. LCS_1]